MLQPISRDDKLVNNFIVEQTEYVNILSDDGLRHAMTVMFEC
jgi:hypothetical protein